DLNTAPHTTANLTSTYTLPIGPAWEASISGTVSYRSSVFLNVQNTIESPSQTMVNSRISFDHAGAWGFYLWGENLTDDRGFTNTTSGKFGLAERNYL